MISAGTQGHGLADLASVQDNGYSNVLECLGSNLRDWLSNLNSLHDHLQASYPKGFVAPVFWCADDNESKDGAIFVHYFSQRGSLLVPLVVGLIKRLAREYFDIEIDMDQLQLQDEANGVKNTTWRVMTVNPEDAYKLRGKRRRKSNKTIGSRGSNPEDDTVTLSTTPTTTNRYERTFREGGAQASNLRVEEFVKRSFNNPDCELYHALTREHYLYLCEYWKEHKTEDGKWCYNKFAIGDDDGGDWATLKDLPGRLNPGTFNELFFGGKIPETGAYPPDINGSLQSIPPKVYFVNDITGKSQELVVGKDPSITLEEAIYNHAMVDKARIKEFPQDWMNQLDANRMEIKCVVWNEEKDEAYHTFSLDDLKTTSTKQLYDLTPGNFDPIKILLQCEEEVQVGEDEEDI